MTAASVPEIMESGMVLLLEDARTFSMRLAQALGGRIELALILQQVHYLSKIMGKTVEGQPGRWFYMSVDEWQSRHFPCWSQRTLARHFKRLKSMGLLHTEELNKLSTDRTLWYQVNYVVLQKFVNGHIDTANLAVS